MLLVRYFEGTWEVFRSVGAPVGVPVGPLEGGGFRGEETVSVDAAESAKSWKQYL